jgi:hypothetical protein
MLNIMDKNKNKGGNITNVKSKLSEGYVGDGK